MARYSGRVVTRCALPAPLGRGLAVPVGLSAWPGTGRLSQSTRPASRRTPHRASARGLAWLAPTRRVA